MDKSRFVIIFLGVMLFTYLCSYLIVGKLIVAFCYIVLALLAFFRGKFVKRRYLFIFPLCGMTADLFFLPIIPTVFNLTTLFLGLNPKKNKESQNA